MTLTNIYFNFILVRIFHHSSTLLKTALYFWASASATSRLNRSSTQNCNPGVEVGKDIQFTTAVYPTKRSQKTQNSVFQTEYRSNAHETLSEWFSLYYGTDCLQRRFISRRRVHISNHSWRGMQRIGVEREKIQKESRVSPKDKI